MENIKIESFGQIEHADITLGDLTFFVGPQASGKSILLQLIKLILDEAEVGQMLNNYGYIWNGNKAVNLELFFGEGMSNLWSDKTDIQLDGKKYDLNSSSIKKEDTPGYSNAEQVFYIPAQRVLCFSNGWPRYFNDFDESVSFVLREFSELQRLFLASTLVYDNLWQLDSATKDIFSGGIIKIDQNKKKRLMLEINGTELPYMAWSSGQKEFLPLAISFDIFARYQPGTLSNIKNIIVEEPEMGLHPEAIKAVILQILGLIARGYKVIVSTHSPVLLEFAWAFNMLKAAQANDEALLELFNLEKDEKNTALVKGVLSGKTIKTYYFQNIDYNVNVKDISSLDAGNEDLAIAEWGGLSSFASKASEIVSLIAAK